MSGKTINTISAKMTQADSTGINDILAGQLVDYEQKFQGGVALTSTPTVFNRKNFSVGKKYTTGQTSSCSVFLPNVKASKSFLDIQTAVVGKFTETYESETACEYANLFYDKKE